MDRTGRGRVAKEPIRPLAEHSHWERAHKDSLSPASTRSPSGCTGVPADVTAPTIEESADSIPREAGSLTSVRRPANDAVPPRLKWGTFGLVVVGVIFGIALNLPMHSPDRFAILDQWLEPTLDSYSSRAEGKAGWLVSPMESPDGSLPLTLILFVPDKYREIVKQRLAQQEIFAAETVRLSSDDRRNGWLREIGERYAGRRCLAVSITDNLQGLQLEVASWLPRLPDPVFRQRRSRSLLGLYAANVLQLVVAIGLVAWARAKWIRRYRNGLWDVYRRMESDRVEAFYRAKAGIKAARRLHAEGEPAKALVELNKIWKRGPALPEVKQLRKDIAGEIDGLPSESIPAAPVRAPFGDWIVYIRIVGTPYAYQSVSGASTITIGRQRRRPDEPPEVGNDLVIRLPNSDAGSLRISRRHLEIDRIGDSFFVIDLSRNGTMLNGAPLPRDAPMGLVSGDRLLVANILSLEINIRLDRLSVSRLDNLRLNRLGGHDQQVEFEASLGDIVTEETIALD